MSKSIARCLESLLAEYERRLTSLPGVYKQRVAQGQTSSALHSILAILKIQVYKRRLTSLQSVPKHSVAQGQTSSALLSFIATLKN